MELAREVFRKCAEMDALRVLRSLEWREQSLRAFEDWLTLHESEVLSALAHDLGKPEFEAFSTEFGFVLSEVRHTLREFRVWAAPVSCPTPLKLQPGRSLMVAEPKGPTLILVPWNYPFQLAVAPMVAALAAGNCVVIKPSEFAPRTAALLADMAMDVWPDGEVQVVLGDAAVAEELVAQEWSHVFFTGSEGVGRRVYEACASRLIPVTLELGGKSPCVIDADVDLDVTLSRVLWGKFLNAGQTCVAPDYLLVHRALRDSFLDRVRQKLREFYGEEPLQSPSLAQLVSERHLDRMLKLLSEVKPDVGGRFDRSRLRLEPTVVLEPKLTSPLMQEEIFGPILPVLFWESDDELGRLLRELHSARRHPLAFYVFSRRMRWARQLMDNHRFGGGAINDVVLYMANPDLPFGGVGRSGFGAYHGAFGFETFSSRKALFVRRGFAFDLPIRYPPYGDLWRRFKGLFS